MRPMPILALALALALPAGLAAQTATGTLTGTLGLDPANWTILANAEVPTSNWKEVEAGYRMTVIGYPETERPSPDNAMTITFTADSGAVEPAAENARVELARSGAAPLVATGQNIDLSLTAFEVEGDDIAIAGNLVAAMTPGGSEDLVADGQNVLTFDGNFQATIPQAE